MSSDSSPEAVVPDVAARHPRRRKPGPKRGERHSGQFKPGQCGNPGGRPKLSPEKRTFMQMVKQASPKAVEVLEECLDDPSATWKDRYNAAIAIIEFSEGKAVDRVQIANMTGTGANAAALPKEILDQKVANLLAQGAEIDADYEEVTDV